MDVQILQLLSAFPHFTLGISLLFLLFSIWKRRVCSMTFAVVSALICAFLVLPHTASTLSSNLPINLTVSQFNVYHSNDEMEKMTSIILETDADVISVQELNSRWSKIFYKKLIRTHPYFVEESWVTCCYGIGLFSRYPIRSYEILHYNNIPLIRAEIDVNNQVISIVSVHTQAPAFPDRTDIRNAQINRVENLVADLKIPHIVLGDFNIVPWDCVFKRFIKNTELKVARGGFQATFPMDFGIPLIPIDHILYSEGLVPISCKTGYISGSDHMGIVAGFHVNNLDTN